jgi:hypothetical protein
VHPGHETSTHNFSCSGGPGAVSTKSALGHVKPNLILHPVRSLGHEVHYVAFGEQKIDTLFFMFGWDRYRLYKKCVETRYTELVFFIQWDLWVA